MNTTLAKNTIILLGAGHTHAHILRMWQMQPIADARLVLVSNFSIATYSGMLPGTLAGLYEPEEMEIDLVRLCQTVGATFLKNEVTGVDAENRRLLFADRPPLRFEVLSIGIGSVPRQDVVGDGDESVVLIKPMQTFLQRLGGRLKTLATQMGERPLNIAVAGGGIAGLEIAFCLPGFLKQFDWKTAPQIALVDSHEKVGRGLTAAAGRAAERELAKRKVELIQGQRFKRVSDGKIELADGSVHKFDLILLATSAVAPRLLSRLNLPVDDRGFLLTANTLQTKCAAPIFAVGDSGTIEGENLPKAGVYAVRQGPVLWENIQHALHGEPLAEYEPQRGFLKLLSTGDGRAIASYRGMGLHSDWCWKWKDWIDRNFMLRYQDYKPRMASPAPADRDEPMRCVGCGGKVGGDVLSRVLEQLEVPQHSAVQVGLEAPDDAAVLTMGEGRSVVATHDFFAPPLDDHYLMGRVAMLNAASDLFAMGSRPVAALAAVTLPFGPPHAQEQMLLELMSGATHELREMGATLAGGHTIEGPRVTVGFTLLGDAQPESLTTKSGLRPGDLLVLTKPLGTGVLLAAHAESRCRAAWMDSLVESLLGSNKHVAELFEQFQIRSATDVTGFGLAGHLLEMLEASGVSARIHLDSIQLLPGTAELFAEGRESTMAIANRSVEASIEVPASDRQTPAYAALFDPQTSGGLLLGVDPRHADGLLARLGSVDATVLGQVVKCNENTEKRLMVEKCS